MHAIQDLRLIALLPQFPYTIDRALVAIIVIGLSIIGGLLLSKAHGLDNIIFEYEDLKKLYTFVLLVLTALIRVAYEVA